MEANIDKRVYQEPAMQVVELQHRGLLMTSGTSTVFTGTLTGDISAGDKLKLFFVRRWARRGWDWERFCRDSGKNEGEISFFTLNVPGQQKGIVRDTRTQAEAAYRDVMKLLNAMSICEYPSGIDLNNTIDHLNAEIEHYRQILARKGVSTGGGGNSGGGGDNNGGGGDNNGGGGDNNGGGGDNPNDPEPGDDQD